MTATIRMILGTALLVLLLSASGLAMAETQEPVYPPTPPSETEMPTPTETATPTEETETPTEGVLPTETVSPTPAEDVEVLPQVLERMPVTGAALAGLLALAAALLVAGVTVLVLARRRGRTTGA